MLVFIQNIFLFIILILVQVLALNNIQFLGYINPYIYILFIFTLPVRTPQWLTLLLSFLIGIIIDIFSNTMGMHAFASVLIGFLRPYVIKLFISIDEGNNPTPTFYTFGVGVYVKYVVVLVLIHHFTLFFIEAFSFQHILIVFSKAFFSSVVSILIILGIRSINTK